MLLFPGSEVLLLSERERDALLELQWLCPDSAAASSAGIGGPLLLSLAYSRVAYAHGGPGRVVHRPVSEYLPCTAFISTYCCSRFPSLPAFFLYLNE